MRTDTTDEGDSDGKFVLKEQNSNYAIEDYFVDWQ